MSIDIKHPGLLHKKLHKKQGAPLDVDVLRKRLAAAKRSGNIKLEKELVFALNSHHFHHGDK